MNATENGHPTPDLKASATLLNELGDRLQSGHGLSQSATPASVAPGFTREQVEVIQRIHDVSAELLRCLKQLRDGNGARAGASTKAAVKKASVALRQPNQKHILIVEDEQSFREIVKHILLEEGYAVTEAVTGTEAIEKLGALKPDLILLDLCLPDMDGWDVIRHLKQNPPLNKVKVLALSGLSLEEGQIVALRSLTWGFLPKASFTIEAMKRRLSELLGPN
jgi:CheY-like chemotaxis protein